MNPWWETTAVPSDFLPPQPRDLFEALKASLEQKPIDILVGLRRTGKTTLMFELIDHLLKSGIDQRNILYFSFDERAGSLREIIREYEEKVLRAKLWEKRVFLFLDEIHKLPGWWDELKLIYDLNPKVKIVASGSASLNLMGAKESLAGRCMFHRLDPLSFAEFLRLRGERIPPPPDFELHEHRLSICFQEYLRRGFPEILRAGDKEAERYVKELVLERILYRDIPETFGAHDTELLRLLVELICSKPGLLLHVDSLSRDVGRSRVTVANYLSYLELTYIIRRTSNVRGTFLAASRKSRKGYPYHPCFSSGVEEAALMETVVAFELGASHYWRLGPSEVDFVLKNGEPLPIEVKYKPLIDKRDLKGIRAFCKRFGCKRGLIITKTSSGEMEGAKLVPLLHFLLYKDQFLERSSQTGG